MPLSLVNGSLLYFAHVPKCAGSSTEAYLKARFGPLALMDRAHYQRQRRWTRSSPQHALWADMARLIPAAMLGGSLAIVRHPVDRLVSVFLWQREWEKALPQDMTFSGFLDAVEAGWQSARRKHTWDNHASPMAAFMPPDCTVFRLEDGLEPVVDWLDAFAGNTDGPRRIGISNRIGAQLKRRGRTLPDVPVSDQDRTRIATLYAGDFEQFGYDPSAR
ncbi:MAG: sulfotransferase family 2 domain-containing protein [Pseudomonadota bacterium]